MLPEPLHPAVVHLPIALAVLIPGCALLVLALVWRRVCRPSAWAAIVLLQALLVGSSWVALETGEREEDRAERFVAERHIEAHEEAAEQFMLLAGLGLVVLGAGLLPGSAGAFARAAGVVAALGVLAAGVAVGHSGGDLVYKHGAAAAYAKAEVDGRALPRGHHDDD